MIHMADFNIETSRALQTLEAGRTRGSVYVNQTSGLKETDMSGSTENLARNTEVRPLRSRFPRRTWRSCGRASQRRAGLRGNWSQTGRKACSWRRPRSSPATGRPITTGAGARRG